MLYSIVEDKIVEQFSVPSKMWKCLERPAFGSGAAYCNALELKKYRVSDFIIDIATKPSFPINTVAWPLPLVRVSLNSVGLTVPTALSEFYEAASLNGFANCPAEAAFAIRLDNYDEQPKGEWLQVAVDMDKMIDSDSVPHLPILGKALGQFYLQTSLAYPGTIFYPDDEFVMIDRRIKLVGRAEDHRTYSSGCATAA